MHSYYKFICGVFIFLSIQSFGQTPANAYRSSPSVVANDAHLHPYLSFYLPIVIDTSSALIGRLDSLGMIIYVRSSGTIYKRDTTSGGHKWSEIASGSGADSTLFATIYRQDTALQRVYDSIAAAQAPFTTTTPGIVNAPGAFNSRIFVGADNTWRTAVIPTDTASKWIGWGYRSHDSIYLCKGNPAGVFTCTFAWKDSTGGGGGSNISAGLNSSIINNPETGKTLVNSPNILSDRDTLYFVGAGQSNMGFHATAISGPNLGDTVTNNKVFVWNWNSLTPGWVVAKVGTSPFSIEGNTASGNSLWYFAKKIQQLTGKYVKIVVQYKVSQPIAQWFNCGTKGVLMDSLTNMIIASGIPTVDGFMWDQGEADNTSISYVYTANFDSLKSTLRRLSVFPYNTPIMVVGMPQPAMGSTINYSAIEGILKGVDGNRDPYDIFIKTDSAQVQASDIHYSNLGLAYIGAKAVEAFGRVPYYTARTILYPTRLEIVHSDSIQGAVSTTEELMLQNTSSGGTSGMVVFNNHRSNCGPDSSVFRIGHSNKLAIIGNIPGNVNFISNENSTALQIFYNQALKFQIDAGLTAKTGIVINGPTGGASTFLQMQNNGSNIYLVGSYAVQGGVSTYIFDYVYGNNTRLWMTNNAIRMGITGAGNLLIGNSITDPGIFGVDISNGGLRVGGNKITSNQGLAGVKLSLVPAEYNDNSTTTNTHVAHVAINSIVGHDSTTTSNTGITYDTAVEMYIGPAPVAKTNVTLAKTYSFEVNGRSLFKDTLAFKARATYNSNVGASFTLYSLVDKNYVDSAITHLRDSLGTLIDASPKTQLGQEEVGQTSFKGFFLFSPPADAIYQAGGWVKVNSISSATIHLKITFTDPTGTAQTIVVYPVNTSADITTTGFYLFPQVSFKSKAGEQVGVSTDGTITTSINYDWGMNLVKIL